MRTVAFFRIALAAPLVVPLLALPLGSEAVSAIIFLSLGFGGIQYVVFAAVLFYALGRLKTQERMEALAYAAPLLFLPFVATGWLIQSYIAQIENPDLVGIWEALLPIAAYSLLVGYVYVGIVMLVFKAFSSRGWVRHQPAL
ncbi:hypothetical protein [Ideonella sp. B508-1]|uniref:hypothetical protein n=1 Tax=Ideonella sp. B508-1 TaxID=137716 RepID=UPI00058CD4D7|nr:hypothetical protein [Ideonella sp. B508-1]